MATENNKNNKINMSLQERYAPNSICFGCGPANKEGLHIQSYAENRETICQWTPLPQHEAFPGILNGGIIGTLLDCHSNWTAAWHLMNLHKKDHPPCTVTAYYNIQLKRPTPSKAPLQLRAWVLQSNEDRATIQAELLSNNKICATCEGLFVAVKEGHPAFHRWS